MTINTAIEKADARRVNVFTPEDKAVWVNQVESAVQRDVMRLPAEKQKYFKYDENADDDLTLTNEWEEIYVLFLVSMFDFWSEDSAKYNNSASLYNSTFSAYKKQYRRDHPIYSGFTNLI